jgi:hypothetical protein
MAARNRFAAQWWIWRTNSPPRTSNDRFSDDSWALDISTPRRFWYTPLYATTADEGSNQNVR